MNSTDIRLVRDAIIASRFAKAIVGHRLAGVQFVDTPTDFTVKDEKTGKFTIYLTRNRSKVYDSGEFEIIPCCIHEAAHCKFSFFEDSKRNEARAKLYNLLEDARVNHLISQYFPNGKLNEIYEEAPDGNDSSRNFCNFLRSFGRNGLDEAILAQHFTQDDFDPVMWWREVTSAESSNRLYELYDQFIDRFFNLHERQISRLIDGFFDGKMDSFVTIKHTCKHAQDNVVFQGEEAKQLTDLLRDNMNYYTEGALRVPAEENASIDEELFKKILHVLRLKNGMHHQMVRHNHFGRFDDRSLHKWPMLTKTGSAPIWKTQARENTNAVVGILMDVSGSMDPHIPVVRTVCNTLVAAARKNNFVVIGGFYTTFDSDILRWSVNGMPDCNDLGGGTPAVAATNAFDRILHMFPARKHIIIHVTDGEFSDAEPLKIQSAIQTVIVPGGSTPENLLWNAFHAHDAGTGVVKAVMNLVGKV